MNWDDIELKLLAGVAIEIDGVGKMHVPTLKEIIEIGESKYNQILSVLLFEKKNLEGKLDDALTDFEYLYIITHHDSNFKNLLLEGLKLLFKTEAHPSYQGEDVFFVVGEGRLDKTNFPILQELVKRANWVKQVEKEDEYRPANPEVARVIAEMMERRKNKPKPKPTVNMQSIISGMAWKSEAINIFNIFNLTIFQFYDGFNRLQNLNSSHYTMIGIYTGNVDAKKINMQDLNFAKIIESK